MKKVLLLLMFVSILSCNESDNPTPTITAPANAVAYFKGALNGQALDYSQSNYTNPTHGYAFYVGYSGGPGYFDKSHHYGCFMAPINTTDFPQIQLTYYNLYNTNSTISENDAFYDLFTNTTMNFLTSAQENNLIKGIGIDYKSPTGVLYSTLYGDQTGSLMNVSSSTSGIEYGGGLKIKTLVGTANCKLYNENNRSDVILLTNVTYKLIFRQFE